MDLKERYKAPMLRNKVDVYTKQRVKNEVGKYEHRYAFHKSIFCTIRLVRKKTLQAPADTEVAVLTHEIYFREKSLPDIDETYRFKYKHLNLQAKYIDYDFDREGMVFVHCEQVVE